MMNQHQASNNVEELAGRLDQMNVEPSPQPPAPPVEERLRFGGRRLQNQDSNDSGNFQYDEERQMSLDGEENFSSSQQQQRPQNRPRTTNTRAGGGGGARQQEGNILIVTNLDPAVFGDRLMKAKFESLFAAHDERVTIRYLKSFRRVRLDFTSCERAERARQSLNNYKLGATAFKCFIAQIIRANFDSQTRDNQGERVQRVHGPETDEDDDDDYDDYYYDQRQQQQRRLYSQSIVSTKKGYLNIPKLTRQFLISPPMSPPENWRPKEESEPCIDVQLLAAIANLVPGQTHELHAGNESQPGIVVEVCEEPYFDTTSKLSCKNRLPKTAIPGTPRPEPAELAAGDPMER